LIGQAKHTHVNKIIDELLVNNPRKNLRKSVARGVPCETAGRMGRIGRIGRMRSLERTVRGGGQAPPLVGERERQRGDEREPAGDLASPDAGEQALALQVDPRVGEFSELGNLTPVSKALCLPQRIP
jgi:hypothetical protein